MCKIMIPLYSTSKHCYQNGFNERMAVPYHLNLNVNKEECKNKRQKVYSLLGLYHQQRNKKKCKRLRKIESCKSTRNVIRETHHEIRIPERDVRCDLLVNLLTLIHRYPLKQKQFWLSGYLWISVSK